jgi:hypothetical protein
MALLAGPEPGRNGMISRSLYTSQFMVPGVHVFLRWLSTLVCFFHSGVAFLSLVEGHSCTMYRIGFLAALKAPSLL